MLSPLQERVAEIIAGLDEARDFALAGGGAMIVRGDIERQTRDLDFFGPTANAVDQLVPAVDRALRAVGLTVHRVQESHDLNQPFATWSLSKLADYLVAEGVVTDIPHEGLRQLLREDIHWRNRNPNNPRLKRRINTANVA